VATKICLEYLSPAEIIAARFALAVPAMLVIAGIRGDSFRFVIRHWRPAFGCSLILVAHLLIQVEGMKTTTATNTVWLITTIPVFIVVFAYFFLGEKLSLRQGTGMAIAAIGVIVLVSRGRLGTLDFLKSYGDWMVLASCLTWTFYTILGKKLSDGPALPATIFIMALCGLIIIPPVIVSSGPTVYFNLPSKVTIALLYLGIFCFALAYWFWTEGLKRKTAGRVGVYLFFEPVSTMLVAPYVLGEAITASLIGGGVLVILGVWLVERQGRPWAFVRLGRWHR
jgi:drug/metabolite transporter (DMT)-like permease